VLLADGTQKRIVDIQPGDLVRSGPGPDDVAVVEGVYSMVSSRARRIQFVDATAEAEREVVATDQHLFWVDGKGWTAAENVHEGDWLSTFTGKRATVTGSAPLQETSRVYTLRLGDDHAFYAAGVLVHDLCGETLQRDGEQKVEVGQ
jgi:hypothetical protein